MHKPHSEELIEAVKHAVENEHSLEDVLYCIKDAYESLDEKEGDETDYWRENAEFVQSLIDSLP